MKKVLILFVILVYNYSFSQYKFVLEGKVQDETKKKIYLEIRDNYSLNEYIKKDSCSIENGIFRFSGELNKKSEIAKLFFLQKDEFNANEFRFVLDTGLNVINVNIPKELSKSVFSNTKRPSSVSNEIYEKQNSLYESYFEKYATDVKIWDPKKPEEVKLVKFLNNREMNLELRMKQLEVLKSYPDTFYSLIFLYQTLHFNNPYKSALGLLEIFNNFNAAIKNDFLGVEFNKECEDILKAEEQTREMHKVPVFKIKTDKGEYFTNASLLGKPYIIAFSATWCAPCKLMEPKLKLLYDNYKNKGLEVVYFNLDDNDKKWKEHISKNQLNWINVSDGLKSGAGPSFKKFNIPAIPNYFVVDRKGTIIYNSAKPKDTNFLMLENYIKKAIE